MQLLGMGIESSCHQLGGLGSKSCLGKLPQWGPGRSPGKFGFLSILGSRKSRQNGRSDNVLFRYSAYMARFVVNDGACMKVKKLNSMESVQVDIENVVTM